MIKVYCVVKHTGAGYIVHHVYSNEKAALKMKVFCQGLAPGSIWDIKHFEVKNTYDY